MMDLMSAILSCGLRIQSIEEMFAEKDYDNPFWLELDLALQGAAVSREEVGRMHDWRCNPMAALPNFIGIAAKKLL